MTRLLGLVSLVLISSVSQAQNSYEQHGFRSLAEMQKYLSVASVRVEEVPVDLKAMSQYAVTINPTSTLALGNDVLSTLGPVLADPSGVSGWIALGKKVWEIVVANRPVVTMGNTPHITVLPNDKAAWSQMSGWRGPVAKSFSVVAKNLYGIEVVQQTYTVAYNYGGNLNGKGAYLANATIIPANISVAWGYTLNSNVDVGQILNMGTVDSPVPGVDMSVKWKITTILSEKDTVESFFVQGDGAMKHITR